jgi:Zn-dependent protease with chaperone function
LSPAFLLGAVAALAAGHLLISILVRREGRIRPAAGAAACLSLLSLRVVLSVSIAILALQYVGTGSHFSWVPDWCLHMLAPLPLSQWHAGLGEHALGDVARLMPALLIIVSASLSVVHIFRGHRKLGRWVRLNRVGDGPAGSLIVDDPEMVLAVAGVHRPEVIVSPLTLINLEDDELLAGLQHELAHIKRRHQAVNAIGSLLAGLSRPIPGGGQMLARLQYYIERDADEYAVRQMQEPTSLARAIVKLAASRKPDRGLATASLANSGVPDRLGLLINRRPFSTRTDVMLAGGTLMIAAIAIVTLAAGAQLLTSGSISPPHIALTSHFCA